jgi:hypothetical protein
LQRLIGDLAVPAFQQGLGPLVIGRRTVKVMSVVAWSSDTTWMIMSTLMLASASGPKMVAATPGLSATRRRVIWASSRENAMPVTICCSTMSSSSQMRVPGLGLSGSSKEERT